MAESRKPAAHARGSCAARCPPAGTSSTTLSHVRPPRQALRPHSPPPPPRASLRQIPRRCSMCDAPQCEEVQGTLPRTGERIGATRAGGSQENAQGLFQASRQAAEGDGGPVRTGGCPWGRVVTGREPTGPAGFNRGRRPAQPGSPGLRRRPPVDTPPGAPGYPWPGSLGGPGAPTWGGRLPLGSAAGARTAGRARLPDRHTAWTG